MWLRWDLNSRLRDTSPPLYWAKLLFIPCSDACHLKSRLLLAKSSITREKPVWISFKLLFNVPLTGFCFFFIQVDAPEKIRHWVKFLLLCMCVCLCFFFVCLFSLYFSCREAFEMQLFFYVILKILAGVFYAVYETEKHESKAITLDLEK